MKFLSGIFKFLKVVVIIVFLFVVFFLPFEKAEIDNKIVLLNPISLRYISLIVKDEDGLVERESITTGVASRTTDAEGKTFYVFGYSLAAYAVESEEFSIEDSAGKYDYKTIINLIIRVN